jgi:hypothetical protein
MLEVYERANALLNGSGELDNWLYGGYGSRLNSADDDDDYYRDQERDGEAGRGDATRLAAPCCNR